MPVVVSTVIGDQFPPLIFPALSFHKPPHRVVGGKDGGGRTHWVMPPTGRRAPRIAERQECGCPCLAAYAASSAGRAELHIEGQIVDLEPGDSWIVPKGSRHSYKILEAFTALEATTPPAERLVAAFAGKAATYWPHTATRLS